MQLSYDSNCKTPKMSNLGVFFSDKKCMEVPWIGFELALSKG